MSFFKVVAGALNVAQHSAGVSRLPVQVETSSPRPSPDQLADAVIDKFKLSQTDLDAFKNANKGVGLRDSLISEFRTQNYSSFQYIGNGKYAGRVLMPEKSVQGLLAWSKTDGVAPAKVTSGATTKRHEMGVQGGHTRHGLELAMRTREAKQQLAESVAGKNSVAVAMTTVAPKIVPALPKIAPLLAEAAPLAVAGTVIGGGTAAVLKTGIDMSAEAHALRQMEQAHAAPLPPFSSGQPLPPPPPLVTPDQSEQLRKSNQPLTTPATTITTGTPPFSSNRPLPPPPIVTPTKEQDPTAHMMAAKAVNIPAWDKITLDMDHIISGHVEGGDRAVQSGKKTLFPLGMTEAQIAKTVETAYKNSEKVATNEEQRIITLLGEAAGLKIRMYLDLKTNELRAHPLEK